MKLRFTERADKDYARLPIVIRKAFVKQLRFLAGQSRVSVAARDKYSEAMDLWQGTGLRGTGASISKSEGDE